MSKAFGMWIKYKLIAQHALVTSVAWNHRSKESVHVHFGVLRFETKVNNLNKNSVNLYFLDQGTQERRKITRKKKDNCVTKRGVAFDFHVRVRHGQNSHSVWRLKPSLSFLYPVSPGHTGNLVSSFACVLGISFIFLNPIYLSCPFVAAFLWRKL